MLDNAYVEHFCDHCVSIALSKAKGSYQRKIILGEENLSGSSLIGKAKTWMSKYRRSCDHLMTRIKESGVFVYERYGKHNRRILVIGDGCPRARLKRFDGFVIDIKNGNILFDNGTRLNGKN